MAKKKFYEQLLQLIDDIDWIPIKKSLFITYGIKTNMHALIRTGAIL